MSSLQDLAAQWMAAKQAEAAAIEQRRSLEDAILEAAKLSTIDEGTNSIDVPGFKVKVTTRFNRKVDGDKLQMLALENDISYETLQALFRWKPELSLKEWKAADPAVTSILVDAITTSAGRPTFSIEAEDK